jgi:hypothetical protein
MAIVRRMNSKREVSYQVKVRDPLGRWYPSQTFATKAQADVYERQLLGQRDQGDMALQSSQRELSVESYFQIWSAQCRGDVSEGWKISQDQMARDYVLPHLGHRKLIEVRPQDIGWTLEQVRLKGLSAQTVKPPTV